MNKNIDYTALGKRIKNKRIEKGFTQEQLGELCELSAAHIGHIERGTRILSVDVLFRISILRATHLKEYPSVYPVKRSHRVYATVPFPFPVHHPLFAFP